MTIRRRPVALIAVAALIGGLLTACLPNGTSGGPLWDDMGPDETTTTTTMPMMGGPDHCVFTSFCDAFQTIHSGGRGGDLDESRWSFGRVTETHNPSQQLNNNFAPVDAEFCTTHQTRLAPNDSFICGEQFGESNHWMTALEDQDGYAATGGRILQPFDFAGRTGTFDFSVDAKTQGGHSAWPEIWLSADPTQLPHDDFPGQHEFPREGIEILLDADWCAGMNGVFNIDEYHNYTLTQHKFFGSPCFTTHDDMANHFQVKVSQNHVEVWASNDDGSNFSLRAETDVNLPFSRGYWSLEHAQYAADKFNSMDPTTYHWHAVSFDGPVFPADRSYQVPDAMISAQNGSVNLGYDSPKAFTLNNVDVSGATQAWLTYNVFWFDSPLTINAVVNGYQHPQMAAASDANEHRWQWQFITQQVPLSELVNGSNTFQLNPAGCVSECPSLANIDLELVR